MSAVRTTAELPPLLRVVLEQFRVEGLRLRLALLTYASALLLLTLVVLASDDPDAGYALRPNQLTGLTQFLLFLVGIVWAGTSPSRQAYPLWLPVARTTHLAARVLTAWSWTMISVAVTLGLLAGLALLTGGAIGGDQPGLSLPSGGYERFMELSQAITGRFGSVRAAVPAWQWLTPFTATTAVFLLMAAVLLASDRAPGWVLVPVLGYLLVRSAEGWMPEWLGQIVDGRYGLTTLFTGNTHPVIEVLHLRSGEAVIRAVQPDLGAWMIAVSIWGLLGSAALAVTLSRRRDL
jgi:hypothetical protein